MQVSGGDTTPLCFRSRVSLALSPGARKPRPRSGRRPAGPGARFVNLVALRLRGLRGFRLGYVLGLRTFLALDNFEFNVIAFLQALVAFRLDGAVVDKPGRAVVPANKAEALRVVKTFHFSFDSRPVP